MRNLIVYVLGVAILSLATSPALGQFDSDDNSIFGSLFGDIPVKDVPSFPLGGLEEKKEEQAMENEVEKIKFDSPLAKILAVREAQNGEDIDVNTEDEITRMINELNNGDEEDMETTLMSIIAGNDINNDNDVDVDAEAINYMRMIAGKVPSSVEKMIEDLHLSEKDLKEIEGYERVIEDMIGQEMQKDIMMTQMESIPEVYAQEESEEESLGVVDYGGLLGTGGVFGGGVLNGDILNGGGSTGGRRWGRRGGRFGGFGRFRQEQQQQRQQQEEEESSEESGPSAAGRRVLRRRNKQQQQKQQQEQESSESDKPRRFVGTIGRARSGMRATAGLTRENMRKAAEFTTENAYKTAFGLGGVMVDVNEGLTDVVSNIDFDPINEAATKTAGVLMGMAERNIQMGADAATKTAGYLVDAAQRNVPGEIVSDLLTTSEGNPLETVKSVLLKSKRPEAMFPIVEEVSGNYAKVIDKVKNEMDGFLKILFSAPAMDMEDDVMIE